MVYLYDNWPEVKARLKNKFLFIFLDFDGTLVPIAETPDKAVLPEEVKELLREIAGSPRAKLAFISGRKIEDIRNKIGLRGVVYSGNHGLEIEGPKIKYFPVIPPGSRKVLERIKDTLERKTSLIEGVFVEDKGLSLSLHYRLAKKGQIPRIKEIFHETVTAPLARDKIKIKSGKMVLEVKPPIAWNKGKVVLWLLAGQASVSKAQVMPVYIGDDVTDEDAFKALNKKGLTIFVGAPKDSSARYYLKNTGEVGEFLKRLETQLSAWQNS